jgi:hypothetical protein
VAVYLLMTQGAEDDEYRRSALVHIKVVEAANRDKYEYIAGTTTADLDNYKMVLVEHPAE